jgi:hypothetical protein
VKHFYNVINAILNIQDIVIINAFCDGVSDIKIVEEIAMKKPKIVTDILTFVDVCIKVSEARAWLIDTHNKGSLKKKPQEDPEVKCSYPLTRRNGDCSIILLMLRSGVRFIAQSIMIWRSAELI